MTIDLSTTGMRIQSLFSRKAGKTQKALAEYCGVSNTAVSSWIRDRGITQENLKKIADYFQVDINWLMTGEGQKPPTVSLNNVTGFVRPDEMLPEPPSGFSAVKECRLEFKAGHGLELDCQEVEQENSQIWIRDDFFYRNHVTAKKCRLVQVLGDSMEPTLCNRDKVVVEYCNNAYINEAPIIDGAIYALIVGTVLRMKRVSRIKDGFRLISDNPSYPSEDYIKEQTETIRVYGRVIMMQREI